jgi:hypothetical protein
VCGRPFMLLVRVHTKAQTIVDEVVIEVDEWQLDREDEDRTDEREEAEPGVRGR